MGLEYQIPAALALDFLVGDPRCLPHPVKMIGRLAAGTEGVIRKVFSNERVAGIVTVLIVLVTTGLCGWGAMATAGRFNDRAGDVVSILILYTCFAVRDLVAHSSRVSDSLLKNDLVEARSRVGMIVGRDTEQLDEAGIVRAAVESVAENTVDGVTAPLFWAVIGGPLGALLYKAVNTMDSMFGYRNEKYLQFGMAAARLDDLVNFLPARLTGLLMVVASFVLGLRGRMAWRIFLRDRLKHASPNSGHAEAAAAGTLGIQLGGLNYYFGEAVRKPTIGDALEPPEAAHLVQVNRLLFVTTILAMAVFLAGRFLFIG
jgi:adenosylcobinamide-phosphate synthase